MRIIFFLIAAYAFFVFVSSGYAGADQPSIAVPSPSAATGLPSHHNS